MLQCFRKLKDSDFLRLFVSVFVSELGGYLTNTVILIYVFQQTGGDKFFLGIAQVLFVAPIAFGTLLGGAIGEVFDRRRVMLICEACNLVLVLGLIATKSVVVILAVRALIVFFAGVYTPSRQAIVQEIVPDSDLKAANAAVMTIYAVLQSVGPLIGAYAYQYFGGVSEIFLVNFFTYAFACLFLLRMKYEAPQERRIGRMNLNQIYRDVIDGFDHIRHRSDLFALIKNFSVCGVCLGVFYPTLLPFIAEVFNGDELMYGQILGAFGLGGILGGGVALLLMRYFTKGKILVVTAAFESVLLLVWTQLNQFYPSLFLIFIWGTGMVLLATTYINYIQVNVSKSYQSRAFSLYDQSISLSVVFGAAIVAIVGESVSATTLLTATSLAASMVILARLTTSGIRELYLMET